MYRHCLKTVPTDLNGDHELLMLLFELLSLHQVVGAHEAGCQHRLSIANPADHLVITVHMCMH